MKIVTRNFAAALLLTLYGSASLACGHCAEDRIAAVYDHALLQQTIARKHQIAYFALEGRLLRNDALRHKISGLVAATPGVNKNSTRVSLEPGALAVTYDPQRDTAEALESLLQKRMRAMKLSVLLLQAPPMQKLP